VFFCFAGTLFAQQPSDLDMEGLSGKVKRIVEEIAPVKMKNGALKEGSRRRSREVIFDKQGRVTYRWIQILDFDANESNYSYDKNKRINRTKVIKPFAKPGEPEIMMLSSDIFRYDPAENAIYEDVYAPGMTDSKIMTDSRIITQKYKFIFDRDNRLSERIMLTTNGKVVSTDKYIYGEQKLPTERRLSLLGNPRLQIIKYSYELDAQGNWIKRTAEKMMANAAADKETEVTYRKISYY
jgi:hypothetical protein